MAIKAGQYIHDAQGFVLDRIQTGGVTNFTIPEEQIYELGDYRAVATLRDIPDLSFDLETTDITPAVEAIISGKNPNTLTNHQELNFDHTFPLDIISPFRSSQGNFDIVKGIITPYLTLEKVDYKYAVKQTATQTFSFRTDSIYYTPGVPRFQEITMTAGANVPYTLQNSEVALPYVESGNTWHILSACVKNPATGVYKRLFFGSDYTDTTTTITVLADQVAAGYTKLHVTYAVLAGAISYLQGVNSTAVTKPAAIRPKDIDVYVSDGSSTPTLLRWAGVQNFDVTRTVNLDNDEEFGNSKYVATDYDVPTVTGTIGVKSFDTADLFSKIQQVARISGTNVTGPFSSGPLEVQVKLRNPDTGAVVKTLDIPDARFDVPAIQGKVQTKLEVTFKFTSDAGLLKVYNGTPS